MFWLKARAGWVETQPAREDRDGQVREIRIIGGLPDDDGEGPDETDREAHGGTILKFKGGLRD
jgi:hypothetical protein